MEPGNVSFFAECLTNATTKATSISGMESCLIAQRDADAFIAVILDKGSMRAK